MPRKEVHQGRARKEEQPRKGKRKRKEQYDQRKEEYQGRMNIKKGRKEERKEGYQGRKEGRTVPGGENPGANVSNFPSTAKVSMMASSTWH